MTPVLAFDIETIPDTTGIRRLYGLGDDISEKEVADLAFYQRRQAAGHDFLPLYLHRVVAIACALRDSEGFRVWSLGGAQDSEAALIQRFFDGIEKFTPQLVSWNGGGFDLPVLHYRSLVNRVQAARYWGQGEDDRDFKWNNYISRYHARHLDMMDLLALYQGRAAAPLDDIAQLLGFPGKLGMDGSKVWEAYQNGEIAAIRNYCETDTANTYLVYLRFQMTRGQLTTRAYEQETELVRASLHNSPATHWREFLARWPAA
ncbi:MAG: 3'-5' exonuclease [Betaproteobacteria bacterium]|nr:3'-5' exonuclease [Betaproteobacteria bacterium]